MLNHRLVVFVERDIGKSVEGIFPAWNFIKETRYGVKGKFDLDCEINRGKNESNLLLINHFVSNLIPDERASKRINYQPFLQERVEKCSSEFQNFPTYIGIDFYKKSDVLKVVNIINGVD
jgi:hypothetical protein